jgi:hypothetical protein
MGKPTKNEAEKISQPQKPETLEAALELIAGHEATIAEQGEHIANLESIISKAQAEGKIDALVEHEGKKYTVACGVNFDNVNYSKADIIENPEVVEKILAISGQNILKLQED